MTENEKENNASAVLDQQAHQNDPLRLARENASLRDQLAMLQNNVVQGGFRGEAPRYVLNEPGFYDDTFFPAGSSIDYLDTPNLSMVPINDPAKRAMAEHIAFIENGARTKAAMAGRQYFGQVNDRNVLLDMARLDAQNQAAAPVPVVQMPVRYDQVPAMPHTDEARAQIQRGRGRPRKVVASESPPGGGRDLGAPTLPAVVGRMVS